MQHAQNTGSRRRIALPMMTPDRWTAVVVWLVGVWATRVMVLQLGVAALPATIVAFGLQWVFTRLERRVWLRKIGIAPVTALMLDMASNAAGLFVYIQRFGQTDVWRWLQTIAAGLAGQPQTEFSVLSAVALSAALGYAIARTPEELWNGEERHLWTS